MEEASKWQAGEIQRQENTEGAAAKCSASRRSMQMLQTIASIISAETHPPAVTAAHAWLYADSMLQDKASLRKKNECRPQLAVGKSTSTTADCRGRSWKREACIIIAQSRSFAMQLPCHAARSVCAKQHCTGSPYEMLVSSASATIALRVCSHLVHCAGSSLTVPTRSRSTISWITCSTRCSSMQPAQGERTASKEPQQA